MYSVCRNPKRIRLSKLKKSQILDFRAHPQNYGNIVVYGLPNWEQLFNMSFGPCETFFHSYLTHVLAFEKKNKKFYPIWLKFGLKKYMGKSTVTQIFLWQWFSDNFIDLNFKTLMHTSKFRWINAMTVGFTSF